MVFLMVVPLNSYQGSEIIRCTIFFQFVLCRFLFQVDSVFCVFRSSSKTSTNWKMEYFLTTAYSAGEIFRSQCIGAEIQLFISFFYCANFLHLLALLIANFYGHYASEKFYFSGETQTFDEHVKEHEAAKIFLRAVFLYYLHLEIIDCCRGLWFLH